MMPGMQSHRLNRPLNGFRNVGIRGAQRFAGAGELEQGIDQVRHQVHPGADLLVKFLALRGRAMAGVNGNARARIFCHRVEAELLAIDSYYKTADDIEDSLRRGPAQAWLEGSTLKISAMQ